MTVPQVTGPDILTGTVEMWALGMHADTDDPGILADLHRLADLRVTFKASVDVAVWTGAPRALAMVPTKVHGRFNSRGRLCLEVGTGVAATISPTEDVRLALNDHPDIQPKDWYWEASFDAPSKLPSIKFQLTVANPVYDLASGLLGSVVPGTPSVFVDLLLAAADVRAAIAEGGGGVGGAAPPASSTVAGVVELATTTEATTGTDTTRAVTPAGLKTVADTKANQTAGAPGTFYGVRTAAQWAALGAPTGTGPFWGVST